MEELTQQKDKLTVNNGRKQIEAATIVKIAILTALSTILYAFLKFPISFAFPTFLELQLSDIPALLGGFAMGPLVGSIIVVLKTILKLFLTGSGTAYVGEIADILIGLAFVLPASIIYKKYKTKKSAFWGLLVGTIGTVAMGMLANRFILIPFYIEAMFGGSWTPLLGMCSVLFPNITVDNFYSYYIFLSVLPFNLLRSIISGGLTFALYKSLSRALHWGGEFVQVGKHKVTFAEVALWIGCIIVPFLSIVLYFVYKNRSEKVVAIAGKCIALNLILIVAVVLLLGVFGVINIPSFGIGAKK